MPSDLPALLGGTPVRPDGPPAWPLPDPDVQAALAAAVTSGAWGQYHGEHVCALETELAAFHGVAHALTCASGTLAVEAALRALRVGPGDEVVMAAYDYEPTFLTLHAIGAKPVLIDVHPANWQLDPAKLEAAFTPHGAAVKPGSAGDRPRGQPKAVICSHLHGGLVPMRAVTEIAHRHGVKVIEDAAQAPGATVEGKPAGTWGDVGTLSFGGSKLLTAGRGGALLFNDPQLFQRAKTYLHRGLQQWGPLSELQAAALRPQLRKLTEATRWRGERVRELLAALEEPNPPAPFPKREGGGAFSPSPRAGEGGESSSRVRGERGAIEELRSSAYVSAPSPGGEAPPPSPARGEGKDNSSSSPPSLLGKGVGGLGSSLTPFANPAPDSAPAFYKLGFQYDPAAFGLSRELFVKALRAEGVAFDAGFRALHVGRSPSRFRAAGDLVHAADAHDRCVTLYHPVLSGATADVQQVAEAVAKVYRYRDRF